MAVDRLHVDAPLARGMGWPETAVTLSDSLARIHPDDRARVEEALRRSATTNGDYSQEYRVLAHGGQRRVLARGRVVGGAGGRSLLSGVMLETEAEQADELWFRRLADSLPFIVWAAQPDGTVTYLSEAWSRYTGLTGGTARCAPAVHPDDLVLMRARWQQACRAGERYESRARIRRADGTFRWHVVRASPLITGERTIVRRVSGRARRAHARGSEPAIARLRTAGPPGDRGRRADEGRVPGHAGTRVAHAAERHHWLDEPAQAPGPVARGCGQGGGRHRAQRPGATSPHRATAGREPCHFGSCAARAAAGGARRASRRGGRIGAPAGRRQGSAPGDAAGRRAGAAERRSDPSAASADESAQQRGEVHAGGRPGARAAGAHARRGRDQHQ